MKSENKKTKKRLLIATDNYYPRADGISRFLSEIIPRLERFDIEVIAPAYHDSVSKKEDGINIIRIPLRSFSVGDFTPAKFKTKIIKQHIKEADIVFIQALGLIGAATLFWAHRMRKKTVGFVHSIEWELVSKAMKNSFMKKTSGPIVKIIARHLYKKYDLLFVPSQETYDIIEKEIGHLQMKIVPLGCDTKKFKPGNSLLAKKKLGIKPETITIGYHGRLAREKDLLTLLTGFLEVRKNYDVKLIILGEGVPKIKNMLTTEGVLVLESRKDVVPVLQAMDIYCVTSLTETTCLSVLEAMACELPVIATQVGFVKDYITDKESGFLINFGDAHSLAKILEMLITDPGKRRIIGKKARQIVIKKFNWEETVKGIVEGFEKL